MISIHGIIFFGAPPPRLTGESLWGTPYNLLAKTPMHAHYQEY